MRKPQRNVLDAARRRQAREQEALIDQMCRETGLTPSALAKEAGFRNPTITRPRRLGSPVKFETMAIMINTYKKIMSNKGLVPTENVLRYYTHYSAENVLRYDTHYSAVDDILMTDPTPDRLKLAASTANDDFNLELSDNEIRDLCNYIAELYPIIVDLEEKTSAALPNDAEGRATLRRAFALNREEARRAGHRI